MGRTDRTDRDDYAHGCRIALLIARIGRQKQQEAYRLLRTRVAELMAVVMICDLQTRQQLEELDTQHKLSMLSTYGITASRS